jgi:hypothetical protein
MNVLCDKCGYDSGDGSTSTELVAKVISDGGKMEMQWGEGGIVAGWYISCPNGHDGDEIHLD